MYGRTGHDSIPDAAQSAIAALAAIAKASPAGRSAVDAGFLARTPRPSDYLLRRWAEDNWPDAARRWGSAYPIATGRTLQDYRDVVRRYMLPTSPDRAPHVVIETDQRGTIELELFGADAPLTVANFLQLADRHFFDGNRWHRVVPNFVVQDGDPRGDGNGGPGGAIRDELNRHRYDATVIGMALSGPDTGSSQWFINLSPQPHLDGTYTVFGKVVSGASSLPRIVQGDLIRTIRRQ
jgi:cyclophilin family peptidyl-prolyl cis-trans isomerase